MLAAGRTVDNQDARRRVGIVVPSLRLKDGGARRKPIDGNDAKIGSTNRLL